MSDTESLVDFFSVLDEAHAVRVARESAYRAWLDRKLLALAEKLTATLPPDLRAAGMRFEWAEER